MRNAVTKAQMVSGTGGMEAAGTKQKSRVPDI